MAGLYGGPIIDAHCHLWDLGMNRHPWLRPTGGAIQALGDLAAIRRNYLVEDYRRDATNQNVIASVHVEAGWDRADDPLAEIGWLETLDKSSGVAARYIGFADLAASGAGAVLDRLSEVRRCVGVRQMLSWHPTDPAKCFAPRPGIADEADFRRGVALLTRNHQLLELMLYPYQAEELARLARDFPDQTFIVNHCGSPIDRDRDGMLRWRQGLKLLGSAPNVSIKISALTAYDSSQRQPALTRRSALCILSRLIHSVDATRIGAKQRGLLVVREIAGDRLEAIEGRIKARPQATDRKVAGEYRSIDAKAFDAMKRDLAQAFGRRA